MRLRRVRFRAFPNWRACDYELCLWLRRQFKAETFALLLDHPWVEFSYGDDVLRTAFMG
jgi:hypothetical protein